MEATIEELEDDDEDLRKENEALLSDDDNYEEEDFDMEPDTEDEAFINDEDEEPEPLMPEEDPEEPDFDEGAPTAPEGPVHLAQLATGNANNNNGGNGNGDPRSKLKDFQSTNPPVFSKCTEPLDADDWLRTIENNLGVTGVGNDEKVLFASHFLSGPARAWWKNVKAIQAEGHVINWEEFKAKFCKTHIPSGLIKLMKDKFMNQKQGSMSVVEYMDNFTTLSRYAPEDTDTEEKKKDRFLNGLHDEMQSILVVVPYRDLESLVDASIMVESKRKNAFENRKRKVMLQQGSSSTQRPRSFPPPKPAPQQQMAPPPAPRPNNPNRNYNP
ncbi:hypothetical protein QYE76_041665 [Lolium multiflorum]|uniref:Retrotransposon gag domain-containing protein n=1 Tax=Lolium multiflorum TaxID=4521 RepID=A0AAD8TFB5_LOLMU|nr:hypothetical protein QYE76_041665 [Lolium multiflorum]